MAKPKLKAQAGETKLNIESITYGRLTWINIEKPTEREIEYLAQNYPFHPLDLDDCRSRVQRPKIDEYEDYLFMVFHFPVFNKEARVTTTPAMRIPPITAGKAYQKRTPKRNAATVPVQAPVIGRGMATKSTSPSASYRSTTLPLLLVRANSQVKNLSKVR